MRWFRHVLGLIVCLAFPASVFISPTLFKVLTGGFLFLALGIVVLIVGLVTGSLIWRRLSPESFKKSGITLSRPDVGYVGSEGLGSRLRFEDRWDAIRVEWSRTDYLFVLVITGFFGPGIILLFLLAPHKFNSHMPLPVALGVVALVLLACYCFVRQLRTFLWTRPALRITASSIDVLKGSAIVKTFPRSLLNSLSMTTHTYVDSDGDRHPNYLLVAELGGERQERLCISYDRRQIERLMRMIGSRMSLPVNTTIAEAPAVAGCPELLTAAVSAEAKALKEQGQMVSAIKLVRTHRKIGLKEAKALVESL